MGEYTTLNPPARKILVGGFDGHGSSTTLAVARATKVPYESVVIKYPECSAELMPKLLYSLNLFGNEVEIFDIPVNVKDPMGWINTMSAIANNNKVTLWDHHETNLKYVNILPNMIKLIQFANASEMAKSIMQAFNAEQERELLILGIITDRDSSIRSLVDVDTKEFNDLYNLANVYDVLIRSNLQQTTKNVYSDGIEYIRRIASTTQYPPAQLVRQINVTRYDNIIFTDISNMQQQIQQWMWKTFDELLRRNNVDYLVAVSQVLDRQVNQLVPVVFVVKYWLSQASSPKPLLKDVIGNRKTIGHDDAFSISAPTLDDAKNLAQQVINALQSNFSGSITLIPSSDVARAIQGDFAKILQKLEQVLEQQNKMYSEYLELKKKQVSLLEKADEETRRRAD